MRIVKYMTPTIESNHTCPFSIHSAATIFHNFSYSLKPFIWIPVTIRYFLEIESLNFKKVYL